MTLTFALTMSRRTAWRWLVFGIAVMAATAVSAAAQVGLAAAPPFKVVKQPLVRWMESRKHIAPDALARFTSSGVRRQRFRDLAKALADKDWTLAKTRASQLNYEIVALTEAGVWFVFASDHTGRDASLIYSQSPRRDLILGAPHVSFERGVANQVMILLRDVGARVAIISGAHRCASRALTGCDGTTSVCGSLQRYRDSDVGHNANTLYHDAHVVLAALWPKSIVMSLHGMDDDNDGVKTSLILSNGIKANDTGVTKTAATKLRTLLGATMKPPGAVVSCNVAADAAFKARPLCGHTNVQGRHVNGDANACRGSVTTGTGRFIHAEQIRALRDPYADNWAQIKNHPFHNRLVTGLNRVIPAVK